MAIISVVYAAICGDISNLSEAIFSSGSDALGLVLSLLGSLAIWGGIMEIAKDSGLYEKISKLMAPLLAKIFKGTDKNSQAMRAISANIVANILGLGNAATPSGIEAMRELKKSVGRSDRASQNMILFVLMNCSGLTLIPTTIVTLRSEYGSADPTGTAIYSAAISLGVLILEILAVKFIDREKQ